MQITRETKRKIWGFTIMSILLISALTYQPVFAKMIDNEIFIENEGPYEQTYYISYKIKKGDTLWRISKDFGITVEELQKANNMNSTLIITGNTLSVPQTVTVKYEQKQVSMNPKQIASAKQSNNTSSNKVVVSEEDRYWLAKIIEAEAGIESLEGKIAVGAVVLNRVNAEWFPDTIQEVIFQKLNGVYQFSPVGNGRLKKVEPSDDAYEAADRALAGEDPTEGALYFYNPKISKSTFFKKKELLAVIGNHQFYQ